MIREALLYKAVPNTYATKFMEVGPSEEEWIRAEAISEFLKAFQELTLAVSAHRKPTAHKFLPLVLCILYALKEDAALKTTNLLLEFAAAMCSKFEKYWDLDDGNPRSEDIPLRKNKEIAFNLALVITIVLYPRRKALYLDFFFQKVCKNADQIGMHVDSVMLWMRRYFTLYEQQHSRVTSTNMRTHASEVSIVGSPALEKRKLESEFAQYKSQARVARSPKSEMDVYLEEEFENDVKGFDVLALWKNNSEKFPVLSVMARDFFAITLSTVSSESAFSWGGRILGDLRSSLTAEMFEALVCTKDWLFKTKDLEFCSESEEVSMEGRLTDDLLE